MKTNKALALLLALLMLMSAIPMTAVAADIPAVTNLQINNLEDGVSDGAFELKWTMLDDMSRMKISGAKVMYSTDQVNWSLAEETGDRYASNAYIKTFEDGTAPVPGTTYYFYVCYLGKSGEDGPKSAVVSSEYQNSAAVLKDEFEAIKKGMDTFKPTEKSTGYNKVTLKKGMKIVWDSSLYTLTVTVTAVKGRKVTLQSQLKNKVGPAGFFYVSYISATPLPGRSDDGYVEQTGGTAQRTFDLNQLKEGANAVNFTVSCTGGHQYLNESGYRNYMDELLYFRQVHPVYFQNGPTTPALSFQGANLKVTANALSFGAGYRSTAEGVKASGTILYYKAANAKKWSQKVIAAGKPLKIAKLKPNTEYSLRTVNFVKSLSAADNKTLVAAKSDYSNILKVRTGIATAPDIKSVKVTSKVVTIHHKAEWWYNGVKWIYNEAYDSTQTNYTVTVTLKSAAKGMVALQCSGLGVQNTEITDGKGTTFKFTGSKPGNAKGKSVTLSFLSYTNKIQSGYYAGTSPSVKKTVKL